MCNKIDISIVKRHALRKIYYKTEGERRKKSKENETRRKSRSIKFFEIFELWKHFSVRKNTKKEREKKVSKIEINRHELRYRSKNKERKKE